MSEKERFDGVAGQFVDDGGEVVDEPGGVVVGGVVVGAGVVVTAAPERHWE